MPTPIREAFPSYTGPRTTRYFYARILLSLHLYRHLHCGRRSLGVPALGLSTISHHCRRCRNPIQVPIQAPRAPVLIQLPARASGKAEDSPSAWAPAPKKEIRMKFLTPVLLVSVGVNQRCREHPQSRSLPSFFKCKDN